MAPRQSKEEKVGRNPNFDRRFHDIVKKQEEFIEGEGRNDKEKWNELLQLLREGTSLQPDDVHVFKVRSNALANALWEGNPLWKRHRLGIAFISTPVREKYPNVFDDFSDKVIERMYPKPNGFETIAVCSPGTDGHWTVSNVVAQKGSPVADQLRRLFPQAKLVETGVPISRTPTKQERERHKPDSALVPMIADHLRESLNVILQGPPGTGKSHLARETLAFLGQIPPNELGEYQFQKLVEKSAGDLNALLSAADAKSLVWERVQLHPNYSYDDLVRGMSTFHQDGQMRFQPEDKLLVNLALIAHKRPNTTVVLVLDEINRCNLSSVLGELIFAIEVGARGVPVRLQYGRPPAAPSDDVLSLPRNLMILGTMNTADRSIGMVDYAIRRRFRFLDVGPSISVLEEYYKGAKRRGELAIELMKSTNACVQDKNLRVGHSYFMVAPGLKDWAEQLADRIIYEVVPLLREYVSEGRSVTPTFKAGKSDVRLISAKPSEDAKIREALIEHLST